MLPHQRASPSGTWRSLLQLRRVAVDRPKADRGGGDPLTNDPPFQQRSGLAFSFRLGLGVAGRGRRARDWSFRGASHRAVFSATASISVPSASEATAEVAKPTTEPGPWWGFPILRGARPWWWSFRCLPGQRARR